MNKFLKTLEKMAVPVLMAVVAGVMEFARAKGEAEQEAMIENLTQRVELLEAPKED